METSQFSKNRGGSLLKNGDGHWAFVPYDLPPKLEVDWDLAREISAADRKLSELAGTARTLPNPHLLIEPFSRREAVLSSKIEGTVASLSDLLSYEALGTVPNDRSDVREVANYVGALEYGLRRLNEIPVSLRLMRELHERLMKGVRGQKLTPGEFRKRQNWIGDPGCKIEDATFVPPPVSEMTAALGSLEKYIHDTSRLPPLVRMALIHYQFEAIHPFLDGNGRIGRLLIVLLLVSEKLLSQPLLYLSAFFERHRSDYYRLLLEVSQNGNWREWMIFFLRGVAEQSQDAIVRSSRLLGLSQQCRENLQNARASATLLKLADYLFTRPVVNVAIAQRVLKVSQPAAQMNIDRLVAEGMLTEVTGRQRGRIYMAHRVLSVVEEDKAEEQLPLPLTERRATNASARPSAG
jgi:Fic family protein